MSTSDVDSRLVEAVSLFNEREFFACHDVLEELWSETLGQERKFLQGLIHAAVSLFHFGEGNLGGARKMHDSAVGYLSPFQPSCLGIEVTTFLEQFDRCFSPLLGVHRDYPTGVLIDDSTIPVLRFVDKDRSRQSTKDE